DELVAELAAPTAQEKYDAALLRALRLLAERNHAEALKALEEARAAQETKQVLEEIERLKALMANRAAADRTAQDVQTILDAGRAEEASRLAGQAWLQSGGREGARARPTLCSRPRPAIKRHDASACSTRPPRRSRTTTSALSPLLTNRRCSLARMSTSASS